MNLKKLDEGRYQADVSVRVRGKQERARPIFLRQPGESMAAFKERLAKWEINWKAEMRQEKPTGIDRTILQMNADYVNAARKRERAQGTIVAYTRNLWHFEEFATSRGVSNVADIGPGLCEEYYSYLCGTFTRRGPKSKWETFRQAIAFELRQPGTPLVKDPAASVLAIFPAYDDEDVGDFTEEETTLLEACAAEEEAYYSFQFLNWTGLRRGEAENLPTRHLVIDRQTGLVMVWVMKHTTNGRTWHPKARGKKRAIPVAEAGMKAVEFFLKRNGNKPYLLGGDRPVPERRLDRHFSIAREALLKLRPDLSARLEAYIPDTDRHWLTIHSYRKTFGTRLLNNGMRWDDVREILGHSDVRMTKIYARFHKPAYLDMIDRFNTAHRSSAPARSPFDLMRDTSSDTSTINSLNPA